MKSLGGYELGGVILVMIEVGRSGPGKLRRRTEMESWHCRSLLDGLNFEVDEPLISRSNC